MKTTIEYATIQSGTWIVTLPESDIAEFEAQVKQHRDEARAAFGDQNSNAEPDSLRKMYGVPTTGQLNQVQWKCTANLALA
jgi:hypothetical protein